MPGHFLAMQLTCGLYVDIKISMPGHTVAQLKWELGVSNMESRSIFIFSETRANAENAKIH